MNNEATIEIRRDRAGKLEAVSVVMPIWDKENTDGSQSIDMPFFGIKFHVFNKMNPEKMTHDAIKGFCLNCDNWGFGLEDELIALGWEKLTRNTMVFKVENFVFEQMVHTGEKHPQFIDFEPETVSGRKELQLHG